MIEPRLLLCSGAKVPPGDSRRDGRRVIELETIGSKANVTLQIQDVAKVILTDLSPRLLDLLEIGAYVFTADAGTRRGTAWQDGAVEPWGRDFRFVIPVRDLDFWNAPAVQQMLVSLLAFLSDDSYAFDFSNLQRPRAVQGYLDLNDEETWPFTGVERVIMFSGGLDSLAGAVESAANGERLVLVSHRSVSTLSSRQRRLFEKLKESFPAVPMLHVPIWVNKQDRFSHEATQRTRSFLFGSLGMVVADSVRADGVRFFENGVVSLNLPVADEVLRARASRTTHPYALRLMAELASLILERPFAVDNPYLFKTKAEVVSVITGHNKGELIGPSVSCAHTMYKPKTRMHCGVCSQCIDRRVAVLAAGASAFDSELDYQIDVFCGARKDGYARNMAVNYVRSATELNEMSADAIGAQFNTELTRAVRGHAKPSAMAEQLIGLHKRHAQGVVEVIKAELGKNIDPITRGQLPQSSLIQLVAGQAHQTPAWDAYSNTIVEMLQRGLPTACKPRPPRTEPDLQALCDAILKARDDELVREFPFMQWSSSKTKPDWSNDFLGLWVELKYVRTRSGLTSITEDIAADITKYGDNGRRVLFVVYDPNHLVPSDAEFSSPIRQHGMKVGFVR